MAPLSRSRRSALAIALACAPAACWPPLGDLEGGSVSAGDAAADGALDAGARDGAGTVDAAIAYRDLVLADGPLLYWRFGEKTGTVIHDETGHGYNGGYGNASKLGLPGAIAFDPDTALGTSGTSGITTLGDSSEPDPTGTSPYTMEAWFSMASLPAAAQIMTKQINDANGDEETGVSVDPTRGILFDRYVSNSPLWTTAPLPPVGKYTHVVAVYDGARMILYVDGAFANQTADARPMPPKAGKWTIGMSWADHDIFDGSIDEFAYYGEALSAERIKAHHDVGVGR